MASPPAVRPPCGRCGGLVEVQAGPANFCPSCGHDLRVDAAAGVDPLAGAVVDGRYRLLSLLGAGGMGAVYKAEHLRMGKVLALKLLRGAFAREEGAAGRFLAEARIVSRLSHPHTIAVFDFGELPAGDGLYLAMEYVPGRDLAAELLAEGRLPERRVVEIGQQLLGSLAEAHDAGVVHRDVKPANVMRMQTRSGEDFVKVLDFGIAKLRGEAAGGATTAAGAILGTPAYLAPEQARAEAIDARADLYSVGALLYELLAGRPPFHSMSPLAMVSAHLHDPPPPLRSVAPEVSEPLAAVVHRALEKHPERRWGSADEMRAALLALADGPPALPRPPPTPVPAPGPAGDGRLALASREDFEAFERLVTRLRRSRVLAPAGAALLLAAAGLVAWRWPDVYGALQGRAPAAARLLPDGLRPPGSFDGEEHEPNDGPQQANPLPVPPGPDGAPVGGEATLAGHLSGRGSEGAADVDVFLVEVPPGPPRELIAAWAGERDGEGIAGLHVTLSLHRRPEGEAGRASAPLVAVEDGDGPGRPARLRTLVEPGAYFLSVREKQGAGGAGPPAAGPYRLTVRLEALAGARPAARDGQAHPRERAPP